MTVGLWAEWLVLLGLIATFQETCFVLSTTNSTYSWAVEGRSVEGPYACHSKILERQDRHTRITSRVSAHGSHNISVNNSVGSRRIGARKDCDLLFSRSR